MTSSDEEMVYRNLDSTDSSSVSSDSEESQEHLVQLEHLVEICKENGTFFNQEVGQKKNLLPSTSDVQQPSSSTSFNEAPLTQADFRIFEENADPPANQVSLSPQTVEDHDTFLFDVSRASFLEGHTDDAELIDQSAEVPQQSDHMHNIENEECNMKKEEAQEKRMRGEKYLGSRRKVKGKTNLIIRDTWKAERKMSERGCSKLCTRSKKTMCGEITEQDRQNLFHVFWKTMSWESKRTYVVSTIRAVRVKERKTTAAVSRRSFTYYYHLKIGEEQFQVCKNMYLNTLGLKDSETRQWLSKFISHSEASLPRKILPCEVLNAQNEDVPTRGTSEGQSRRARANRVETLNNFLDSLPKLPSHYCRKSSSKKYLQLDIRSKAQLYDLYVLHCSSQNEKPTSAVALRKMCKEKKIGIFKPRKDRCDVCYRFESGNLDNELYTVHIEKKMKLSVRNRKTRTMQLTQKNLTSIWCV